MSNFRQVDRDTGYLLPPSVDEWLPEQHLARFVVEVIEQLDLSSFVRAYRGSGSAAHHPNVLPDLLICGHATGGDLKPQAGTGTAMSVPGRAVKLHYGRREPCSCRT